MNSLLHYVAILIPAVRSTVVTKKKKKKIEPLD